MRRAFTAIGTIYRRWSSTDADIGTAEAKARLRDLAQSDNAAIAGYAQKRIDRWEEELPRKGA